MQRSLVRLFDQLDLALNDGNGYLQYSNENAALAGAESYLMEAYALMYNTTRDPYYLKKLAAHADSVHQWRDDVRGVRDYRNISDACWRNRRYTEWELANCCDGLACVDYVPCCWVLDSGMITYPMALFARIVLLDPELHDVLAFDGQTLLEKAGTFLHRVDETILAHEYQWSDGPGLDEGYYLIPADCPVICGAPEAPHGMALPMFPWNMQSGMGRTLAVMSEVTGDALYRERAERLARHYHGQLQCHLQPDSLLPCAPCIAPGEAFVWDYWDYYPYGVPQLGEDISHATLNVGFASVAAAQDMIFSRADMERFVATFTDLVMSGEATVHNTVGGCGDAPHPAFAIGGWMGLLPWDDAFQIYFTSQAIYDEMLEFPPQNPDWVHGARMRDIASLAFWESPLRLYGRDPVGPGGAVEWADVSGADLDGDGVSEIVGLLNTNGAVLAYEFDPETGSLSLSAQLGFDSTMRWAGISAGDLDGDGRDELVAASNRDGTIYILDTHPNGDLYVSGTDDSTWDIPSGFAGIGVGVFADGAAPWVAIVCNGTFEGDVYLIEYQVDGTPSLKGRYEDFPGGCGWADLDVGDFDGDTLDEIVALRNLDGRMVILEFVDDSLQLAGDPMDTGMEAGWTAVTSADLEMDGAVEIMANNDDDGRSHIWRLTSGMGGVPQIDALGSYVLVGGTKSGSALATGLFAGDSVGDMVAGVNNRNGNIYVYRADPEAGWPAEVVEDAFPDCPSSLMLAVRPSPTGQHVSLRFHTHQTAAIRLTIHDVSGRMVASLLDGTRSAGSHSVAWDRKTHTGHVVPPGVYFARLAVGTMTATSRIVLLDG
jgi:hypothetical protein